MEWKVSVFPEKNGNGEKPTFRFVGSRHRAKPTFKSRLSCLCLTLLHGSTPHGRSACHSPQTEYTINFPLPVDGSRHGVLVLLEEIDELGEDN